MTPGRSGHVEVLAALVESALESMQAGPKRRLLEHELVRVERAVSVGADGRSLDAVGAFRLIESCRDEYLAGLGPDDGLAVLEIAAADVARVVRRRGRERAAARVRRRCPRCAERMDFREVQHERARPGVATVFRCPACGLRLRG